MSSTVAPPVGAWIETAFVRLVLQGNLSRPPWARGLKLALSFLARHGFFVAPPVGAWIETYGYLGYARMAWSRPPWARGLKHTTVRILDRTSLSRPPWARGLKPR